MSNSQTKTDIRYYPYALVLHQNLPLSV